MRPSGLEPPRRTISTMPSTLYSRATARPDRRSPRSDMRRSSRRPAAHDPGHDVRLAVRNARPVGGFHADMRTRALAGLRRATIWLIAVQVAAACFRWSSFPSRVRVPRRARMSTACIPISSAPVPRVCARTARAAKAAGGRRKSLLSPCPPGARTGAASSVTTTSAIVAGPGQAEREHVLLLQLRDHRSLRLP